MRVALRGRVFAAVVVSGIVGFVAIFVIAFYAYQLFGYYNDGFASCGATLFDGFTVFGGCGDAFHAGIVWAQLLVVLVIALGIGYGLARWVTAPLRVLAALLDQFGPNSLGMRLGPAGSPRDEGYRLARAVDAMLDRVAEGYEAQRRFAANASHELRTPLATQRALIEVSLASALTPDQLELLTRQLLATNERNEALIEGLLVLAETEQGLVQQGPQRLDLIVAGATETLRPHIVAKNLRLDAELNSVEVLGEAALLERLASNLVHNAIKYNGPDGTVHVAVAPPGTFTVCNTGPQVLPEQVNALFEPFRRARGDRLDHGGGVGLGLTIARSIVAAHHGSIVAEANPGGGLRLTVRIPPAR